MPQTGVIILAHGSRGERGIEGVSEALRRVTEDVKPLLPPGIEVIGAALQFNHPDPEEAVESLAVRGVAKCIQEAAPELSPNARISPTSPEAIEQQSMEIAERLLPPVSNMSEEEQSVVKRIVHASGDHQVASLIKFSPSAISSGLSAIAEGSPIFTDVQEAPK